MHIPNKIYHLEELFLFPVDVPCVWWDQFKDDHIHYDDVRQMKNVLSFFPPNDKDSCGNYLGMLYSIAP